MNVLVLDADPVVADAVAALQERGFPRVRVWPAREVAQAFDILAREPIDLILAEYAIPGANGLHFLMAARDRAPQAPRVLMGANITAEVAISALNDAGVFRV
ncbi:MAG: response regulator, partial [Thermoplasmatota archaeon]